MCIRDRDNLVGEVIGLKKGMTTVQVFEETTGLRPGETVTGTGDAISVLLGPGIIHNIFDGIQRPLEEIAKSSGKYISRGVSVDSLDTQKKWSVHMTVKAVSYTHLDVYKRQVPDKIHHNHQKIQNK